MPQNSAADAELTQLLERWNAGDSGAREKVLEHFYDELRRIAECHFRRERVDHTLQATAIVHEAYLVLAEQKGLSFNNRAHFVGLAAHVMRRVLIDHARSKGYAKRGGGRKRVTLAEAAELTADRPPDLIALDDALTSLAEIDPDKARLVELRFFGGLSLDDAAGELGVSRATAVRQWRRARAWLYRELEQRDDVP